MNYLLPRECPRVTFCASSTTTPDDREQFRMTDYQRVVVIEEGWLDRVARAVLQVYELPASSFVLQDGSAGYWVSREAMVPVGVSAIVDLPDAIRTRGADLRVMDRLWPLQEQVVASTLDYSIIRMRNALR